MSIRTRIRTLLALSIAGAALIGASNASAACTTGSTQVFRPWGDLNFYSLLTNGGFENNGNNWTMAGGAAVTGGNEPFFLNGKNDTRSAGLPTGSSVTSGSFCTSPNTPFLRFVSHSSGFSAMLRVELLCPTARGPAPVTVTTFTTGSAWAPTPLVPVVACLPVGALSSSSVNVQLRVTAVSGGAQMDDVYLDPYKKLI
jgi:hypothetical protein